MATIKPRRGTGVPSGLSQNELAIDPTNRRVYLGNAGGTGTVVASHITDYVASLNGETGSIIGVATYTGTTPFSVLQQFTQGISASAGSTFTSATVYITNSTANIDPLFVQHSSTGSLKVATTGQARSGAIRLGNAATSNQNTFISQTDGTMTIYNGASAAGTQICALSTSNITVNTGITASGAITGGSYIYAENGFRFGAGAITSLTGTTYSLLATDNGEVIVWSSASSGVTLTVPSGLPVGFNCTVIQTGTASIGITGSGTTLNSFEGKLRTAGQHAAVSIISYSSNVFNIAGGLT